MAREDTFKSLDQEFANKLDNLSLSPKPKKANKAPGKEMDLPIKQSVEPILPKVQTETLPKKSNSKNKTNSKITAPIKKINKTFVLEEDLVNALEKIVTDDRTKKKIAGMRGLMGKIVSNALIKELIYLGEIEEEEWINRIQDY